MSSLWPCCRARVFTQLCCGFNLTVSMHYESTSAINSDVLSRVYACIMYMCVSVVYMCVCMCVCGQCHCGNARRDCHILQPQNHGKQMGDFRESVRPLCSPRKFNTLT